MVETNDRIRNKYSARTKQIESRNQYAQSQVSPQQDKRTKLSLTQKLTQEQLALLIGRQAPEQCADTNHAINLNDQAAIHKQHHVPPPVRRRKPWKS